MISAILKGIQFLTGGNIIEGVGKVAKSIFGDKEKRDDNESKERQEGYKQFASEFKTPRNWFDSLINGINRTPRPLGFFLTVWMFIWPLYDLGSFVSAMNAYTLFPEWLGVLIAGVWGFYYVNRTLEKRLDFGKGISKKKLEEYKRASVELNTSSQIQTKTEVQATMPNDQFQKEMASSKPLSLPAIMEWNRRRQNLGSS